MKRPTALKAIRAKCIDCSGNQIKEVKTCPVTSCALWSFRMGKGYEEPSKPGVSVTSKEDAAHISELSEVEEELVET